jgi:1-acyl-sn-glycerol-3-phosphate acyltransferase
MLRILLMVLRNFWRVPGAWFKLCSYAKRAGQYPEKESYDHIQYIMKLAVNSGNIDLKITGLENLPTEDGFILYGNH